MTNLKDIARLLADQRNDLLNRLAAGEKAIGALEAAGGAAAASQQEASERQVNDAPEVSARRLKSRRMLTDSHKQALSVAKRKARGAQDAAKGLAREALDDDFVPAIGVRGDRQIPRLVRRPVKK